MKSQLIIIGSAIGLLVLAGASYSLFTGDSASPESPPPSPPPVSQPAPVKEVAPPPQPSPPKPPPPKAPPPTSEQKIAIPKQAIADVCQSGESQKVTLVFTEAEANEQAVKLLAQTEIPGDIPLEIESVHIDFQADNKVETEVKSVIYGVKATIELKAKVSIKEGRPEVEITEVNFGFVPLPKPLKDKIIELVSQKIDALLNQLTETEIGCEGKVDLEFTNIDIQESQVTISIIVKPKAQG